MLKLVLDTATDHYYLALVKDNQVLAEAYEYGAGNQSETMMPGLEKILKENNLTLKDVNEVYVGIGPGSYTGVRIAVVIAKMLGIMNNISVYQFSTLALIASSVSHESYPMIDARRGNAYLSHFTLSDNKLVRLEDDQVVSISDYFKGNEDEEKKMVSEGKPDVVKLLSSGEAKLVKDINALTPNYLQMVEAERKRRGLE